MTNGTNVFSSKQELKTSSKTLLNLAEDIQEYRLAKLSTLTGPQLNSLNACESEVRDKALKISANAIEGILKTELKPATDKLKNSISQTKNALDTLKGIAQVIGGLSEVLNFANQVFSIILAQGVIP